MWHLRGSVRLNSARSNEAVFVSLEQLLAQQRKPVIVRDSAKLEFNDPFWSGVRSAHAMVIYDYGRFWIEGQLDERRLRYDLSSWHGFVFCLIVATAAGLFGLLVDGLANGARFAAGAFAWFYGVNILLAVVRVPLAIRKAVRRH